MRYCMKNAPQFPCEIRLEMLIRHTETTPFKKNLHILFKRIIRSGQHTLKVHKAESFKRHYIEAVTWSKKQLSSFFHACNMLWETSISTYHSGIIR